MQSDYIRRGYASLHIKTETRQRLNLVKAQLQARAGQFMSQDDILNLLLDRHLATVTTDLPLVSDDENSATSVSSIRPREVNPYASAYAG